MIDKFSGQLEKTKQKIADGMAATIISWTKPTKGKKKGKKNAK